MATPPHAWTGDRDGEARPLPSAFEVVDAIAAAAQDPGRRLAVFLDYDGTLTPIVEAPELAVLGEEVRATVVRLARSAVVGIVSGRDLADVRARVGIPGIAYAGSHGFEVEYPDGRHAVLGGGEAYLEALDAATVDLERALADVPGARVERKRFAIAVHYRQTPEELEPAVRAAVLRVAATSDGLRWGGGKKVFELRPAIDWHKGAVLRALLERIEGVSSVVYVGDDVTDEDAFLTLRHAELDGFGVVVGERGTVAGTAAHHRLRDVEDVKRWLDAIADRLEAIRASR